MSEESHSKTVIRQLVSQLRQDLPQLVYRIYLSTDMDYSEDGAIVAPNNKLPMMYLIGPSVQRNATFTSHQKPVKRFGPIVEGQPKQYREYTAEESVDLLFDVVILSNHRGTHSDLVDRVTAYFLNGKTVTAEKNPGTPADGSNTYEIDLDFPQRFVQGRMVNRSNLIESKGRMIVRGVLISDGEIFKEGYVALETESSYESI